MLISSLLSTHDSPCKNALDLRFGILLRSTKQVS